MRYFPTLNPNTVDSKHRNRIIITRITVTSIGSMSMWRSFELINSPEFPKQYGGILIGLSGLLAVGINAITELDERGYGTTGKYRGGRGNGGGGWEPPESPEPQGPGGIPIDTDWINEVEEYLETKDRASV